MYPVESRQDFIIISGIKSTDNALNNLCKYSFTIHKQ